MTRLQANREILKILAGVIEACPDLRFNQIIGDLFISAIPIPEFYEEPDKTLKEVKNSPLYKVLYGESLEEE